MDKLAQDRGIFNKLREKANVTGRILESLNPEFHDMMEKLRRTDERVRTQAENVKELVRSAKSLNNKRDYLSASVNLSAFHERARRIAAELDRFIKGVNLKHYQFLLDQFDDEQKEQLFGYDPNAELKLEDEPEVNSVDDMTITAALRKQAGLSDWWFKATDPIADLAHNVTQQRGVAMRALEKRFSIAFLKQLKVQSNVMVAKSENFLSFLLRAFKKLAAALATRNVDQYVTAAKDYINRFARFHETFVKFYQDNIVPLKEQHEKIVAQQKEKERLKEEEKSRSLEEGAENKRKQQERAKKPLQMQPGIPQVPYERLYEPSVRSEEAPSIAPPGMRQAPMVSVKDRNRQYNPSQFSDQSAQPFAGDEQGLPNFRYQPGVPDFDPNAVPEEANVPLRLVRRRNLDFLDTIQKFADVNDPQSLAMEILRYSAELEDSSPEESLKLLAVAEGLIEDYKTAGIWDMFKKPEQKPVEEKKLESPLA